MGMQEKKDRLAKKIIRAAVKLISADGFDAVSIRQIALEAKIGEATIYRYFPTKYDLLYGYYHTVGDEVIERLKLLPGFSDYSFTEQMQIFIYTHFDLFAADRAFIKETYKATLSGGLFRASKQALSLREKGSKVINDLLDAAVEAGEFQEPPMKKLVCASLVDLVAGMSINWINDDSPNQESTTQLVDKSMALVAGLLKSNLLGGFADILQFLFRQHVVGNFHESKERNFDFSKVKAQFG